MNKSVQNIWTISNIISLARGLLAIPLCFALIAEDYYSVLIICIAAYISDLADGWLARLLNQSTELGKIIDPLADKIFIGALGIILLIKGFIPIWFGAAIILRDIFILAGGLYARKILGYVIPSNYFGKMTVIIIGLVLVGAFLHNQFMLKYGYSLAIVAIVFSLIVYAERAIRLIARHKAEMKYRGIGI
ncbi:MAG: hypothetical protein QG635_482 [Bacteroidota bacterium]|nr:hypothetical protein [Bacteroidota bacterium]